MKYSALFTVAALAAAAVSSCGSALKCPEDPVIFETKENGRYLSVLWNDKEYVPFCSGSRTQMDECLGYFLDGDRKVFICSLKMQSPDEWIIDYSGEDHSELMIYREKNTRTIPVGLYSDYEWNKQ